MGQTHGGGGGEGGGGGGGRIDELQAEVAALRREVGESREMLGAIAGKLDELRRSSDERVLNAFLVGLSERRDAKREHSEPLPSEFYE